MSNKSKIVGALIPAVGVVFVAWVWFPWIFSPSYTIHVATGPVGSDGQKYITALKREIAEEHPRVHLALEAGTSLQVSADALERGKVDLAVVRSDNPAAANGGTIVILRRLPLVIMTPANSSVKAKKDLVGKKIAVLEGTAEDDPLLRTVLEFYGLKSSNVAKATVAEIGALLEAKEVAALIAIGPAGPGPAADAVKAIVKATGKPPKFIDLAEAKAIAEEHPVYEEVEIPQGAFVAAPAMPGEAVSTLAVTVRLVARNSMLNDVASEITRLLLVTRAKLAATVSQVGQIEAPDTDKKGVLPVHPGAAAYIDGSKDSIFDEAMNLLFNASIIGGVVGSIGLWIGGFWRRRRPDETQKTISRLPVMLRETKTVPLDQLNSIEEELDTLSGWLLDRFANEQIAVDRIHGVAILIVQIRLSIERRRSQSGQ
jgi:TRAP transporter TAXI family solute receptor